MSLILLNANAIQQYIPENRGLKIEVFEQIDSTNQYLKQNKSNEVFHICLAEHQTAGRGRFDRPWISPFGANIYLSMAWHFHKTLQDLGGLSLMMGLAAIQSLTQIGLTQDLQIKWPNDILCQAKKLAGILIETQIEVEKPARIIVGIGMNVNMPNQLTEYINQPWTSINQILGSDQDRNRIAGILLNQIIHHITEFEQQGFSEKYIQLWQQYDYLFGKNLSLKVGNEIVNGMVVGVNYQGHILLKHHDGKVHSYASADVTTKLETKK